MFFYVGLSFFFFSSRRRHTRFKCDWSSDVCSSDLRVLRPGGRGALLEPRDARGATLVGLLRALGTPRWAMAAALWRTVSGAYGRFTFAALWGALEAAGLRVVSVEEALGGLGWLAVAEK